MAKSIADKIDLGYVISKIDDKFWNSVQAIFRQGAREGTIDPKFLENDWRPTHVLDVYKNRRGRLKDIRIWTRLDLGTGARKDLFITNAANYPIEIPDDLLFTTHTEIIDWHTMMKEGQI